MTHLVRFPIWDNLTGLLEAPTRASLIEFVNTRQLWWGHVHAA